MEQGELTVGLLALVAVTLTEVCTLCTGMILVLTPAGVVCGIHHKPLVLLPQFPHL